MPKAIPADSVGGKAMTELSVHAAGGALQQDIAENTDEGRRGGAPADQAPEADETAAGGTPGKQVPGAKADEGTAGADDWKKSLAPEVAANVDRVITELRQKDSKELDTLKGQIQQLGWARDLSALAASDDPSDRAQAARLLRATLGMLEQKTPDGEAEDPLAKVDWDSVEAIAPGLGTAVRAIAGQNAELRELVGQVRGTAESAAYRTAERELDTEASQLEAWAKERNLPFDLDKVLKTEDQYGLSDLRAAYRLTYFDEAVERGKQSAYQSLKDRKLASLPGGGPIVGKTEARPKFKTMEEAWEWAKREKGISGQVEGIG